MRTSWASCSGVSAFWGDTSTGSGSLSEPTDLKTAFFRSGLPGVTSGKPATSTISPGRTRVCCSVSIRAALVPSFT